MRRQDPREAGLDNPFFSALDSLHREVALRRGGVARYPAEVAPFLGVGDAEVEVGDAFDELVPAGDGVLLLGVAPVRMPPRWRLEPFADLAQMVREEPLEEVDGPEILALGESHREDVLALVALVIAMSGLASYGIALAGKGATPFGRMPLHSTLLLLLATLGWLCASPTLGLTRVATADTLGGALARRLLLPAVFAFVFELLQTWLGLPEALAFVFVALFSGGAVAGLVWWVANLFDKLERQRRESIALRNDAGTDILTGLPNRRAFDEALAGLLRGQREHDTMFSLLMLDLDHFKTFNDEFGHLAGDQVLRITGHLLRAALRPADMAARYGGEEFVLLLPGTDISGASEVATRLLDAFRGFAWPQRTVTVSIGMAQAVAGDAAEDLIRRADSSLYDAKRGGRDRAVAAIALPQVLRPGAFPRAVPGS